MSGLLTINGLMRKLLDDIRTVDFSAYQRLIAEKHAAAEAIRQGKIFDPSIAKLNEHILPQQKAFLSLYVGSVPRIERIISVMEKREAKVFPNSSHEYAQVLAVLREFSRIAKPAEGFFHHRHQSIFSLIEEQQHQLDRNNPTAFLQAFKSEMELVKSLLGIFQRLPIAEQYDKFCRLGFRAKRIFTIANCLFVLFMGVVSTIVYKGMNPDYQSWNIKEISYAVNAPYPHRLIFARGVINSYREHDFEKETKVETDFEQRYGVEIYGDYHFQELATFDLIMEASYGKNIFREFGINRIIFVPTQVNTNGQSEDQPVAGFFNQHKSGGNDIFVESDPTGISLEALRYLLHELTHALCYRIEMKHSKFLNEWNVIRGGYVS